MTDPPELNTCAGARVSRIEGIARFELVQNGSFGVQLDTAVKESCLFCKSHEVNLWYEFQSSYKQHVFPIYKCGSCAGSFVLPRPSEEYLEEFYTGTSNSHGGLLSAGNIEEDFHSIMAGERVFPNATVDAERLVATAMRLTAGKQFLDVGAGFGFFSNAAKRAGLDCTAIEISPNGCNMFERMNGFRPITGSLDEEFVRNNIGRFDIVLLSQVLEHLPNLSEAVTNIWQVLKKGGICIIAVPHYGSTVSKIQGKKDMFITPPEHINYFSIRGLKALFADHKFELAQIETISKFNRSKVYRKAKVKPVGFILSSVLDLSFYVSDRIGRGMFINAYFRKPG